MTALPLIKRDYTLAVDSVSIRILFYRVVPFLPSLSPFSM